MKYCFEEIKNREKKKEYIREIELIEAYMQVECEIYTNDCTPNRVSFKGKWNHNKFNGRSANDLDEEAHNDKEGIRRRREDEMKEKKNRCSM